MFGGSYNKDFDILESILGFLYFGKLLNSGPFCIAPSNHRISNQSSAYVRSPKDGSDTLGKWVLGVFICLFLSLWIA